MVLNYLHKDCKFQEFQGESLVLMLSAQISLFSSQYSPSIPPVPAAAHLLIISDICTERLIIYPGWRALITSSNYAHLNNRTKGTVKLCLVTRGVVTPSQLWAKNPVRIIRITSDSVYKHRGHPFSQIPFGQKFILVADTDSPFMRILFTPLMVMAEGETRRVTGLSRGHLICEKITKWSGDQTLGSQQSGPGPSMVPPSRKSVLTNLFHFLDRLPGRFRRDYPSLSADRAGLGRPW